ncbi:kunitz-type trypsin inhibitor-like 2 protein [Vicia villosa]|uniref:kunitz-type trypsin inhibitor-like 2 protein n=1 Tax=Vicia villosa TaxID=3911 RepID=UPI00273BAD32|nr:kunitz-type trypsin inhibitor-like 2 protein [Vicia villosa]
MNHVLSLILSFLLFTFITNLPSNTAGPSYPTDVLDTDGDLLIQGSGYYIQPVNESAYSGGISLGKTANSKCPLNVVQSSFEFGFPVKFTIPKSPEAKIFTGYDVVIEFRDKPLCAKSSEWSVFVDNTTQLRYVGISGPENDHGVEKINGKFVITEYRSGSSSYSLLFCYKMTGECAPLGLNEFNSEEGFSRLVLKSVNDFPVEFFNDGVDPNPDAGDKTSNMR